MKPLNEETRKRLLEMLLEQNYISDANSFESFVSSISPIFLEELIASSTYKMEE